uniref:RING-type domain-containing protein n=1 Tax=Sander lucioperca TaxID=283035 RepID=A0A8D0D2H7_SANLU
FYTLCMNKKVAGSRMEDTEKTKLEELLMCPVCQDIFKDPRQLPCGHSMCMGCLENMMDHSSDIPFRCPDCRAHFGPIIGVQKSVAVQRARQGPPGAASVHGTPLGQSSG